MKLIITSPKNTIQFDSVQSVTLQAPSGSMQVLPSHADCFTRLIEGDMEFNIQDKEKKIIPISSGICGIVKDTVTIIL